MEKYNGIRPKAETTFSSLKRTIAHWHRSHKKTMQRKEAYMYVIAYNMVRAVINPIRLILNEALRTPSRCPQRITDDLTPHNSAKSVRRIKTLITF